jgi:uncharacterized OsmC-like protein
MDREQLRARQAPLKQRYGDDPESARTTISARASFTDPGITCTVDTWAGPVRAGLHTATGGDGSDACSADMLMQALIGCMGVTLRSVATAMRLDLVSAQLSATGEFDARGTLGLSREAPVGATDIVVTAVLDTDATDQQLARLGELTERYCVVGQTVQPRPTLTVLRAGPGT